MLKYLVENIYIYIKLNWIKSETKGRENDRIRAIFLIGFERNNLEIWMNSTLQFHFLTSPLAQVSRFPTLRKPIDRRSERWWWPSRMPFRTRPNAALSFTSWKRFLIRVLSIRLDNRNDADFLTNRNVLRYFFSFFFVVNRYGYGRTTIWSDLIRHFRKISVFHFALFVSIIRIINN